MADGVPITAGSGTTIATDDTGATGHAQLVKLAISTDGSPTLIPADAANGIDVDVTRVSGNVTVVQGTGTNLKVDASAAAVPVTDNSGSLTVDAPLGTPVFATLTPNTTGGWAVNSQTALTTTKVAVKASAGTFGGYMVYNPNTVISYVQVFDVASAGVTLGSTAPTYVLSVPPGGAANVEFTAGINHATAITLAATTTPTGSSAPSSNLVGFFLFK